MSGKIKHHGSMTIPPHAARSARKEMSDGGGERVPAKPKAEAASSGRNQRPKSRTGGASIRMEAAFLNQEIRSSAGQPLDGGLRSSLEARSWSPLAAPGAAGNARGALFELEAAANRSLADNAFGTENRTEAQCEGTGKRRSADFSSVRLHSDRHAQLAARRLRARAFTIGEDIYTDPTMMPASQNARWELLSHELAHVMQQRQLGRKLIQPRLIVTGTDADVQRFIDLAQAAMGEQLARDPVTNEVTAGAPLPNPATSPVFAAAMHRIMDDAVQNAEAQFGVGQPGVAGGAFPQPTDMTGPTVQTIDIDDIEALEAGVPGYGIAALAHELTENYEAHGTVPVAGTDLFEPSHERARQVESDVTEDTIGPGRRVAEASTPEVANVRTIAFDFENYYIVFDLTRNPATADFSVSNTHQAPRVNVSTTTIDNYVTGSSAVPAADTTGAASATTIAAIAADLVANPTATVRIEGFTDDVGVNIANVVLSMNRASDAEIALQAAGVSRNRIHTVGLGEARPVAPNTTVSNRARNRRVVFIVDRPGP
jgi:hypothetical protein